jgi:hypothetical protein
MGKSKAATPSGKQSEKKATASSPTAAPLKEDVNDHLPPIFLVFTVMVCSGFLFMYSFRDVFATGRTIGGFRDHAYLVSTNKIRWQSQSAFVIMQFELELTPDSLLFRPIISPLPSSHLQIL